MTFIWCYWHLNCCTISFFFFKCDFRGLIYQPQQEAEKHTVGITGWRSFQQKQIYPQNTVAEMFCKQHWKHTICCFTNGCYSRYKTKGKGDITYQHNLKHFPQLGQLPKLRRSKLHFYCLKEALYFFSKMNISLLYSSRRAALISGIKVCLQLFRSLCGKKVV